ncbi:hypothetical protein MNBD_GAMMA12-3384 [hydrothermal vent metagenome]|uniref:Nucleotidyltransferase n=1 Tax=hydrothermal vent metagenome TaxID=652676 RepID=A0A3B0Z0J2_9ZZZZ
MPRHKQHEKQLREQITQQAARLMSESGIRDFQIAKQKAAVALGVTAGKHMPSNCEIEKAVIAYQRLFEADEHPARILNLRRIAEEAMSFLAQFNPRLTGSVLAGTATRHAPIELHLFCDYPEQVNIVLMDARIPYEEKIKRMHLRTDEYADYPLLEFLVDEVKIELVLFSQHELRQAPLSPVDGKPIARASLANMKEPQTSSAVE